MGTRKEEIPALMKKLGGERDWYEDEVPQHEVVLADYFIARYPVTHGQYWAFVQSTGYKPPTADFDSERPYEWRDGRPPPHLLNHPVVLVTWRYAMAYCQWLTGQLRNWDGTPEPLATLLRAGANGGPPWEVRLPTEAEWEKAAQGSLPPTGGGERGGADRIFPWGNEPDPERANYVDTGIVTTSAVGCFPGGASPYGVEDLSGNIWEWTHSLWGKDWQKPDFRYPYDPKDGREDESAGSDVFRVLRGGAFFDGARLVRCAIRRRPYPIYRLRYIGFRVVVAPGFTSGRW